MEEKISIVLPVYNVEKYLEKCLNSVINQTYTNTEIILVDDGSTDKSAVICESFKNKDKRIIVIHKKNGGLSDARNTGTKIASGKYITYIDSDDFVEPDYIEYLYYLIKKFGCDMSLCTHTVVKENNKQLVYGDGTEEILCAEECIRRMLYHDTIDTSAWAKMYRTDLARETLYPEGKLFEDIGTTYLFFIKCGKIACGYQSKYFYILRKNSIVTGKFNPHKLDLLEMTDKMANDVAQIYPELHKGILRRRVYARFSTLNQLLDVKGYDAERKQIIDFILRNKEIVLADKRTPKRDIWAIRLLNIGYPVYKWSWKIISNIIK